MIKFYKSCPRNIKAPHRSLCNIDAYCSLSAPKVVVRISTLSKNQVDDQYWTFVKQGRYIHVHLVEGSKIDFWCKMSRIIGRILMSQDVSKDVETDAVLVDITNGVFYYFIGPCNFYSRKTDWTYAIYQGEWHTLSCVTSSTILYGPYTCVFIVKVRQM